jgi:hypothetical protein
VQDTPSSTSLLAPVMQTPATESESNSMDTSSEVRDRSRVVAETMTSSDALSFGSSEQQAASSEEPPTPTSVDANGTQRQLAMLTELFHEQSSRMHELEDELAKLKGQAGSSHPQFQLQTARAASEFAPPTVRVTPKDVILESFHGSKDPESLVIDKEFFLPLLSWLRASVMQLRASKLPQSLWVSTLLGALRGAAKKSFTRVHGEAPIDAWSLSDFQLAVASLVPEHRTQFTEAALAMHFSAKSLCDDIARFALLMKNGEIECNSKFIFRNLQTKLLEARPDILSVAASQFNLHFQFSEDFDQHISAAQAIAERMHGEGLLTSWVNKVKPPSFTERTSVMQASARRGPTPRQGHGAGRRQGAGPSQQKRSPMTREEREAQHREFSRLAREHSRCYGCGYLVSQGELEGHKAQCTHNRDDFRRRMGQVAAQVKRGQDPNKKLRDLSEANK